MTDAVPISSNLVTDPATMEILGGNRLAAKQGAGSGNVVGPASAVDGHLAVYDGTTGKLIKDGGAVPSGGITLVGGTSGSIAAVTKATFTGGILTGTAGNATMAISGGSFSINDGSHTVASVATLTVTGAVVGGTTPDATLTISGGSAAGPTGTVQMSDGAGAFVASRILDILTVPSTVNVTLQDKSDAINQVPGVLISGTSGVLSIVPSGTVAVGAQLGGISGGSATTLFLASSDGTPAVPTKVTSGFGTGQIISLGFDGTSWQTSGNLQFTAQSDFSGTPLSSVDLINASNIGLHIAADGTFSTDNDINIPAGKAYKVNGVTGFSGTITATDLATKTITVVNGMITTFA